MCTVVRGEAPDSVFPAAPRLSQRGPEPPTTHRTATHGAAVAPRGRAEQHFEGARPENRGAAEAPTVVPNLFRISAVLVRDGPCRIRDIGKKGATGSGQSGVFAARWRRGEKSAARSGLILQECVGNSDSCNVIFVLIIAVSFSNMCTCSAEGALGWFAWLLRRAVCACSTVAIPPGIGGTPACRRRPSKTTLCVGVRLASSPGRNQPEDFPGGSGERRVVRVRERARAIGEQVKFAFRVLAKP